ncbi:MAG: DUF3592 domain-containing protein [Anaerolineae bacterium]|nr:MAG: DUF3592 domain-containing protein [Anaerolineae bacterium]
MRRRRFNHPFDGLLGGPIAILIGAILLFFGQQTQSRTAAFVQQSARAEGIVVDLVRTQKTDERGNIQTSYYPVIEFTTAQGELIRYQASTGSNPPSHQKGDKVQVLYNPANPQRAVEDSFFSLWLPSAIMLGSGALVILIGIVAFLRSVLLLLGVGGLLGLITLAWLRKQKQDSSSQNAGESSE